MCIVFLMWIMYLEYFFVTVAKYIPHICLFYSRIIYCQSFWCCLVDDLYLDVGLDFHIIYMTLTTTVLELA